MRKRIACGLAAVGLAVAFAASPPPMAATERPASAAVKVELAGGHGSGVHIGGGLFLTAGHVAQDAGGKPIMIRTSDGKARQAEVLWVNGDYDLALLRVTNFGQIETANLSCRGLVAGEDIYAEGNPANLDFVRTYGHVAGGARQSGPWRDVVVTDMVIIPGMSGGPVFDQDSRLVGIAVGVMTPALVQAPLIGAVPSLSGIGYIVPATDACMLMGRA